MTFKIHDRNYGHGTPRQIDGREKSRTEENNRND